MPPRFPFGIQKSVEVYHLESDNDYPGSADATITGGLLPLDRHAHALEGGQYRDPHELYVESTADVREGDKLVIDSTNYYVKRVFNAGYFGRLRHKRCTISKE